MRPSRRQVDELRAVSLDRGVVKYAEGSCFVKFGDTHVLVTATLEDRLPPWLKGQGRGWVTAEYGMLPRATNERTRREASAGKQGGRTLEIQRLIGRSLRAVIDLPALGERQITVDCDVIQADGGTRTAAITGAWVALSDCLNWMKAREMLRGGNPLRDHVAAVSCGVCNGVAVLDLDYAEDFAGRHRCEFRHDRRGQPGRGAGDGRKGRVQRGAALRAHWPGPQGHYQAGRPAEARRDVMHRQITGRLVIATHNKGKLAEMRELLGLHGVEAMSASDLSLPEPEETGTTFAANARLKAEAAANASGLPAFADDSGLVVDALDGAPGIYSARWAGEKKDFRHAMEKVEGMLRERDAFKPEQRKAHFVSVLAVAWPDGQMEEFEGRVDGTLVWPPRGEKGFGYDPMFLPDGFALTFGEMSCDEKHGLPPNGEGLSHRARAFIKLAEACLARR